MKSLENLDVDRPEVATIIALYLKILRSTRTGCWWKGRTRSAGAQDNRH